MLRIRSFGHGLRGAVARPARALGRLLRPLARQAADLLGLVPALFAGAGVFLIVAGLFSYFTPGAQGDTSPTAAVTVSPAPYTLAPRATTSPTGSGGAPSPTGSWAIATRIVIPALNIDLPIQAAPANEQFPLCNTAEYLTLGKVYAYPGAPQAVYLYAHARVGMFWQLLAHSKINNGAGMIGMWVEVYTADDQRHIYEITQVIRHVPPNTSFANQALAATTDQLWMQTSEGHADSSLKLQVVAMPIGVLAASYADSHPKLTGTVCPDAPLCTAAGQGGCRKP
ncbi:MAG: hypothetical protein ABSA21_04655 [Candidatus Limnocylindrales bacterium]|jgi:hypothetical protein